jgi:glycosyltransferase involved in cell wall biosynthesis
MTVNKLMNKIKIKAASASKITLFTRSLEYGGAERQLVELAKGLHNAGHRVTVLTFYPHGNLEAELLSAGVPLQSLNKKGRWEILPFYLRCIKYIRTSETKLLYAFLGVPCIIGLLARLIFPQFRIIWGVRASGIDLARYDWLTRASYLLECRLSRYADLIITNSDAGRQYALSNGFPGNKTIVIPNGIDTERFRPDPAQRNSVRAEWSIPHSDILIGIVGRLDPMKDHPLFLQAARIISQKYDYVSFVCIGNGPEPYEKELKTLTYAAELGSKLIWAGAKEDMTAVYNALDILVSSSYTEGFPNVIGEAMSCGVPCVATDVGDSRLIVADTGFIVPPKEPELLAEKLVEMIERIRKHGHDSAATRQRIVDNYSVSSMTENTIAAIYDTNN